MFKLTLSVSLKYCPMFKLTLVPKFKLTLVPMFKLKPVPMEWSTLIARQNALELVAVSPQ